MSSFCCFGGANIEDFSVEVLNLEDIIKVDESFSLGPRASKELGLRITAPKETGIYTGKIIIKSGNFEEVVLVTINVKTEKSLFDITMSVLNKDKKVEEGGDLSVQFDLLQMGIREKMDVILAYVIKDFDGKIYLTESETIAVETEKTLRKDFSVLGIPVGDYVVGAELVYPDGVAVTSSQIKIGEELEMEGNNLVIISLISALAMVAGAIGFMTIRHRRMLKKIKSKKV